MHVTRCQLLALCVLVGCSGASAARPQPAAGPARLLARHRLVLPSTCRQLVLVTVPAWTEPRGTLRRYTREREGWQVRGADVEVHVGSAGLGWGRGLHRGRRTGPVKREGDRRSPAGAFRLGVAFGTAAERPYAQGTWPWRATRPEDRWIDDPASPRYNTWQRALPGQPTPWRSAEDLSRYDLALVVEHNTSPVRPGAGSAIFLHPPSGEPGPTVGCTEVPRVELIRLLEWLDPEAAPVLVQVPER